MLIYPAIDIFHNQCVRLRQGRIDDRTIYDIGPVEMGKLWEQKGARYLHVIDLDGALEGKSVNHDVIQELCQAVSIPVQVGGGIRRLEDIEGKLSAGAARVSIGTAAVKNPPFLQQALRKYGADKIIVGIDIKEGKAALEGWEESSEVDPLRLAVKVKALGVKTLVVTDIERDGMMTGPNLALCRQMKEATDLAIICSGGVATAEDLKALQQAGVEGAICGRALYDEKLVLSTVQEELL